MSRHSKGFTARSAKDRLPNSRSTCAEKFLASGSFELEFLPATESTTSGDLRGQVTGIGRRGHF